MLDFLDNSIVFFESIFLEKLLKNFLQSFISLEDKLEKIISGAALMADADCTREDRRERIVQEANNVRQALQDLLNEYVNNAGNPNRSAMLESAIDAMVHKNRDLKRQLRKAVVDHVSEGPKNNSTRFLYFSNAKNYF